MSTLNICQNRSTLNICQNRATLNICQKKATLNIYQKKQLQMFAKKSNFKYLRVIQNKKHMKNVFEELLFEKTKTLNKTFSKNFCFQNKTFPNTNKQKSVLLLFALCGLGDRLIHKSWLTNMKWFRNLIDNFTNDRQLMILKKKWFWWHRKWSTKRWRANSRHSGQE